jgi:hypothetical protein
MPKWPFKWPFQEPRQEFDLSEAKMSTLPESIGQTLPAPGALSFPQQAQAPKLYQHAPLPLEILEDVPQQVKARRTIHSSKLAGDGI